MRRRFGALSCLILLSLTFLLVCTDNKPKSGDSRQQATTNVATTGGRQAPGFELEDLDGERVEFEDFEGKLLLVDFWATWCGPCRRSTPQLAALYEEYRDQGFEIIGISLDRSDPQKVKDFVQQMSIPYTIAIGSARDAESWNTGPSIPVAFLVDRSGTIVNKFVGYQRKTVLDEEIRKYL